MVELHLFLVQILPLLLVMAAAEAEQRALLQVKLEALEEEVLILMELLMEELPLE